MPRLFDDKQAEFVAEHVVGRSNKELAALINMEFALNVTAQQIKFYKKNHRLSSGLKGYFPKGHIPYNKGKKINIGHNAGMFKKGNKPKNMLPVGIELIDSYGYAKVKIAEPNVWKFKHELIWEKTNGKKPAGHKLIFADSDKTNITLDNIILVSNSELMIMNSNHLIFDNQELTKSGSVVAKLQSRTSKLKKRRREKDY